MLIESLYNNLKNKVEKQLLIYNTTKLALTEELNSSNDTIEKKKNNIINIK
jgi:hypothetical protein